MSVALSVENLSKRYRLGLAEERSETLAGATASWLRSPLTNLRNLSRLRRFGDDEDGLDVLWALRDVSFEVGTGEVVGVVGHNGAGKSTLLKILSRITEPTTGSVAIHGRVASLLEVGTGFHPELTGRENVYLNGTILGMKKAEVNAKFDEIVSFAGVERFIDTPVKRYSSGMQVRLAFAVAAHLDPEILIIDEVLTVGDAAFQQKSLGKMREVTSEGRTVVFVSHNMQAVQSLCDRVYLLERGRVTHSGDARSVVGTYLAVNQSESAEQTWEGEEAPGNDWFRLRAMRVLDARDAVADVIRSEDPFSVELDFETAQVTDSLCVGFDLLTPSGDVVFRSYQTDTAPQDWPRLEPGTNRLRCEIPGGILNHGTYYVSPRIGLHHSEWIVNEEFRLRIDVKLNHGVSPLWNGLDDRSRPGLLAPILRWTIPCPV